tara:strand:+ start:1474 stop:1842 length:369 start_codon:yes stop_codon:yes gene_type:complete
MSDSHQEELNMLRRSLLGQVEEINADTIASAMISQLCRVANSILTLQQHFPLKAAVIKHRLRQEHVSLINDNSDIAANFVAGVIAFCEQAERDMREIPVKPLDVPTATEIAPIDLGRDDIPF